MKTFTFRYDKEAVSSIGRRMDAAAKSGAPDVRKNEMVCGTFDTLVKLLSKGKFQAFEGIVTHRPSSLYELAQLLEKDQAQVLKEARSLEAMGLIKLVLVKDGGRERLKPEPLYDKIIVEFEPKRAAKTA